MVLYFYGWSILTHPENCEQDGYKKIQHETNKPPDIIKQQWAQSNKGGHQASFTHINCTHNLLLMKTKLCNESYKEKNKDIGNH